MGMTMRPIEHGLSTCAGLEAGGQEAYDQLSPFGGEQGFLGHPGPLFHIQQTFRPAADSEDGLPVADMKDFVVTLDRRLPHEMRKITSYSRELSSTSNRDIGQSGLVYRFLNPLWRRK